MNYAENLLRHSDDEHIAYYYTSERIQVRTKDSVIRGTHFFQLSKPHLHSCQMAIAGFLDGMCLALRASGLWLRYATPQNLVVLLLHVS